MHYTAHLLMLIFTDTGCGSISVFDFLVGIPIEIMSLALGLKLCLLTAEIKIFKSVIKNKKKNNALKEFDDMKKQKSLMMSKSLNYI